MGSFGIIREMDETGGVDLPDKLLKLCKLRTGDRIIMNLEGQSIVIKKYPQTCVFCGSVVDLTEYRRKSICCNCAEELKKL